MATATVTATPMTGIPATPNAPTAQKPTQHATKATREGITHESFIQAVRALVLPRVTDERLRARLQGAKLVYGLGTGGYRGITAYQVWDNQTGEAHDFIEIAATGEESPVQLAGTTIHELGHVLAGWGNGHNGTWKDACKVLGLNNALAEGHVYTPEGFDPVLWAEIAKLVDIKDGQPVFNRRATGPALGPNGGIPTFGRRRRTLGTCPLGVGTRGGKSRGTGSGSRLRLFMCDCTKEQGGPVRVRVARDTFAAHCDICKAAFHYVEPASEPVEPSEGGEAPAMAPAPIAAPVAAPTAPVAAPAEPSKPKRTRKPKAVEPTLPGLNVEPPKEPKAKRKPKATEGEQPKSHTGTRPDAPVPANLGGGMPGCFVCGNGLGLCSDHQQAVANEMYYGKLDEIDATDRVQKAAAAEAARKR